jgi:hypothetical protein
VPGTEIDAYTIRRCKRQDAETIAALGARLFVQGFGPTHPEPEPGDGLSDTPGVGAKSGSGLSQKQNAPPANRTGRLASGVLQARQYHELVAPVLRAAVFLVRNLARGTLLAVAHDLNPRVIDSAFRKVFLN